MKFAKFLSLFFIFSAIILVVLLSIFVPNFFYAFAGSFASFVLIALLIFVTIGIYLYIDNHKRRMDDASYRALFFVILFVIGFSIRLSCVLSVMDINGGDVLAAMARGVQTLYFSIAGIGFEGQDISVDEIARNMIPAIIYFASMLWMAASYIIIITTGVSYGVYSFFLKLLFCRFGKRSEYYIFTTVSKDAINLADSIRETKGDKAYIIFANNNLEKFDPSNELHKMIKQRKYPYLILQRRQFMNESPKARIGKHFSHVTLVSRSRHNSVIIDCGLLSQFKLKNCSFYVFALEVDKYEKGLESANSDAVFDDIQGNIYDRRFFDKVTKKHITSDEDNPYFHVDYYVLTHNSINYEFYSKKFRRIYKDYENEVHQSALEFRNNSSDKLNKENQEDLDNIINSSISSKLHNLFKINIVNEAYLSGLSLIKIRHELENERIKMYGEINHTNENNDHIAIILGFGQTGQRALQNLYVDTCSIKKGANEKESGEQSRFIAHVYDEKILNIAGQFEKNHPSFLIANVDDAYDKSIINYLKEHKNINITNIDKFNKLLKEYHEKTNLNFVNLDNIKKCYEGFDFEEVDKYLKFPHVYFHAKNCNSLSLLNDIDSVVGSLTKSPTAWKKADSIVIALGDDENNIMTANAILQDIRQELYSSYDKEKEKDNHVDIYVNIRDDKNKHRLNWNSELEKEVHPNIHVVTFGNSDHMYEFEAIIDNLKITKLDSNYGLTSSSSDNFEFTRDKNVVCSLANIGKKYQETMQILDELMVIEGFFECVKKSDFEKHEEELKNAYIELGMKMYQKVDTKQLFNKAFLRKYPKLSEFMDNESLKNFRGKWKPVIKEGFDFKKHLTNFATMMTYEDYMKIIVPFITLGFLKDEASEEDRKNYIGKYLLTIKDFKSLFSSSFKDVSSRKMKEISENRKRIIMSRNGHDSIDADMIFLDISRVKRSFNMNSYYTDSTRYLLSFINYYDTYLSTKDKNANFNNIVLDYNERNYLGQLEHARWCRCMFARGTIYTSDIDNPTSFTGIMDESYICSNTDYDDKTYMKQFIKLHKDLVPYECHQEDFPGHYLDNWLEIYDYLNALLAPFFEREKIES